MRKPFRLPQQYSLLFHDFQYFHGAGLDADAAGDALGSGALVLHDHNLHGAGLDTLAAADTLLLVDHVDTGLGILGDSLVLTGTHALAALDADVGLGNASLLNDLDAAEGHIIFLIECFGAGLNALQASHTYFVFLDSELLHKKGHSFIDILVPFHYTDNTDKMQQLFVDFIIKYWLARTNLLAFSGSQNFSGGF